MNKTSKILTTAFTIAALAASPVAFAQDDTETDQPAQSQDMQEMMQGMQGNGMGMMGMMSQMNEMMSNCNKMMQAMMSDMDMPAEEGEQPNGG